MGIAQTASVVIIALVLTACAAQPRTVMQTPGSVSYECLSAIGGCAASAQELADRAQAHCKRYGKDAQQRGFAEAPSGNKVATFICI